MSLLKRKFLFLKIHPFNFPLALYYSLRGTVLAYDIFMPRFLCRWFKQIDPEDYVDWDEWSALREKASYLWKNVANGLRNKKWIASVGKYETDFETIVLQVVSKEFEKMIILLELTVKSNGQLIDPWLLKTLKNIMLDNYILEKIRFVRKSNINIVLDYLNEWFVNSLYLIQLILRILRLFIIGSRVKNAGHFKYFWCGINPSEQNGGTDKLDFAWTVERDIFPPEQILYFLPAKLNKELYEHYKKRNVNFREPGKYFDGLKGTPAIRILWKFILSLVASNATILTSRYGYLLFRFMCQTYLWCALAEYHNIRIYFTTQGAIWTERPEVAVFNAMGIRTIVWSYSANYTLYRTKRQIGNDPQVAISALETKEFFVWNKLSVDWVKSRLLYGKQPEIMIVGPTMNGDSRICLKSPKEARGLLGIRQKEGRIYIGVFDIPTIAKEARLRLCLGPTPYPKEMVTAFYYDMIKLAENNPQLVLLFKPKRSFNEEKVEYSKAVTNLYREGKIIFMEHDTNPYAPIACSNICIAMPFASPVLAGVYFGRLGIYHDPLDIVKSHMYHGMDAMITHGYSDLKKKVESWLSDVDGIKLKNLLEDSEIINYIDTGGCGDPVERFKSAVLDRTDALHNIQRNTEISYGKVITL